MNHKVEFFSKDLLLFSSCTGSLEVYDVECSDILVSLTNNLRMSVRNLVWSLPKKDHTRASARLTNRSEILPRE